METLFDQYKELNINGSLICLEQVEDIYSYFCYPTNAKAIGFEGSIMYCFIEPYGEMVLPAILILVQMFLFIHWQEPLRIL